MLAKSLLVGFLCLQPSFGFTVPFRSSASPLVRSRQQKQQQQQQQQQQSPSRPLVALDLAPEGVDLDTIALVTGQETYGLAIVSAGEAIYSFLQFPSFGNIPFVLLPGLLSAAVLGLVCGPMVTSGELSSVGTGLEIATLVSLVLGASYVFRLIGPNNNVPKEVSFIGILIATAGFFSYSQNLLVDGFITLPSIELPSFGLPSIELPSIDLDL